MLLNALTANFLHHALHRRVDRAQRIMAGLHIRFQFIMPGSGHGRHHSIRANRNDAVNLVHCNLRFSQFAAGIGLDCLHDVAGKAAVLWSARGKPWRFVATPDHDISRRFNVIQLVPVDQFFVSGEIQHARTGVTECLAYRKQHRVTQATADQHRHFTRCNFSGLAGRTH